MRTGRFNTRFAPRLVGGGTRPKSGQVAQSVEQRIENPRVGGSIPPLATTFPAFPALQLHYACRCFPGIEPDPLLVVRLWPTSLWATPRCGSGHALAGMRQSVPDGLVRPWPPQIVVHMATASVLRFCVRRIQRAGHESTSGGRIAGSREVRSAYFPPCPCKGRLRESGRLRIRPVSCGRGQSDSGASGRASGPLRIRRARSSSGTGRLK